MRLPNLNWPADLYRDVMTPPAEIEMRGGAGHDDEEMCHFGGDDGDGAAESFTVSMISPRPGMTASRH